MNAGSDGISILLWTDVRLYRDWLAQALAAHSTICEARVAADHDQAMMHLRQSQADVVAIDATIPDVAGAIEAVRSSFPGVRVVVFSLNDVDADVLGCAELGIAGYVTRNATVSQLIATIECAMRGELLCPPRIAGQLLSRLASLAEQRRFDPEPLPLTPRELEIGELIERGLSNKEIARRTSIKVATVKNHVHNILEKLNVRRRGEVAARLRRRTRRLADRGTAAGTIGQPDR